MKSVNISEAKAQLSALIAAVETTGERVVIRHNGRVVAELAPPSAAPLAYGAWAERMPAGVSDITGEDADVLDAWGAR
jgi:prevent-host-death family protein